MREYNLLIRPYIILIPRLNKSSTIKYNYPKYIMHFMHLDRYIIFCINGIDLLIFVTGFNKLSLLTTHKEINSYSKMVNIKQRLGYRIAAAKGKNQNRNRNVPRNIEIVGNIVKKTDANGRISLSTKKNRNNIPGNSNRVEKKKVNVTKPTQKLINLETRMKRMERMCLNKLRQGFVEKPKFSSQLEKIEERVEGDVEMPPLVVRRQQGPKKDYSFAHHMTLQNNRPTTSAIAQQRLQDNVLIRNNCRQVLSVKEKEYTLIITNLAATVSEADVVELFGGISGCVSAQMLKPGFACVAYNNLQSAASAVKNYNNRLLDGQAMKIKPIE